MSPGTPFSWALSAGVNPAPFTTTTTSGAASSKGSTSVTPSAYAADSATEGPRCCSSSSPHRGTPPAASAHTRPEPRTPPHGGEAGCRADSAIAPPSDGR
eukprot:CAMPEP_0183304622 /NCGR_PEP_ID=MMETSP0160_2-20130417/9651_2 /TAXON_ID=2839 ORGANISM="Odontella Sinensis, Strain Grunow 1884" /NCGR_SAMPLE_ID=MMETSP0160_2 /ASSEMBLY_ACC=CAM_ASM_000250 /LENGTH=99 /DNA_ID=CAMNT_0025467707 /DNA_START=72 /DNA_END=368 /DNA_ORIENTATION=-